MNLATKMKEKLEQAFPAPDLNKGQQKHGAY